MPTISEQLASVEGVSPAVATDLAAAFPSWQALTDASADDLRTVKGVGPVLASRIQAAAAAHDPTSPTDAVTTETATPDLDADFAHVVDRRRFGPFTLPADLPWPVQLALDTTETVVGIGLKATSGVLQTVERKLR